MEEGITQVMNEHLNLITGNLKAIEEEIKKFQWQINNADYPPEGLTMGKTYLYDYKDGDDTARLVTVGGNELWMFTVGCISKEIREASDYQERLKNSDFMTCDGPGYIDENGKITILKHNVYGIHNQFKTEGELKEYIDSLPRIPEKYL